MVGLKNNFKELKVEQTVRTRSIFGICFIYCSFLIGACSSPKIDSTEISATRCPTKTNSTLCGYCADTNLCRYCTNPYVCSFTDVCNDLKCASGSGSSSSSSSSSSSTSSSSGGTGGQVATNCTCPGNLQCSQKVGCIQTCTCYYTINGSDGQSAWYRVGTGPAGTGTCYMCDQNGLGTSCTNAANAAASAVTAIITGGGQCL